MGWLLITNPFKFSALSLCSITLLPQPSFTHFGLLPYLSFLSILPLNLASLNAQRKISKIVAKVGGDQIHLVHLISKVGWDVSHRSHRVVASMVAKPRAKVSRRQNTIRSSEQQANGCISLSTYDFLSDISSKRGIYSIPVGTETCLRTDTQTYKQTDRHAHHNTLLSSSGKTNKQDTITETYLVKSGRDSFANSKVTIRTQLREARRKLAGESFRRHKRNHRLFDKQITITYKQASMYYYYYNHLTASFPGQPG